MKKELTCRKGFILLETLVSLSIITTTLIIFCSTLSTLYYLEKKYKESITLLHELDNAVISQKYGHFSQVINDLHYMEIRTQYETIQIYR